MTETSAIPMDAEPETHHIDTPPVEDAPQSNETSEIPAGDDPKSGQKEEPKDERLEALNRIARRNRELDAQNRNASSAPSQPELKDSNGQKPGENSDSPASSAKTASKPESASPAQSRDELVPVTVDGKTEMLPLKTVIKGYQIESAARKRLEEASMMVKRLREQGVTSAPSGTSPAATPAPTVTSPPTPVSGSAPTDQDMPGHLAQSQTMAPTTAVQSPADTEALVSLVLIRQDVRNERMRLNETQPHIARDPRLYGMHSQMVIDAMRSTPGLPTKEYFDHASESINKWLMDLSTAKLTRTTEPGQRLLDKREATSKQAPSGVNRKVPSGTDAPPPLTYADKIRQMREARGLN
ncbi:MAG: hypothetical protein HQL77_13910 [Magnetococcales bacterium]|nr:hypothetical protein [Magnetococcales bacterium]